MRAILFSLFLVLCSPFHAESAAQAAAQPADQAAAEAGQAVTLDTPTGQISGTLLLPVAAGRVPVALIVAGSGPTDRDGNSTMLPGPNNSLKQLAQTLAQAGIASVRYDKRGIAASAAAGPSEAALRFDDYVNDAAAWLRKLKADPRFSSCAVIGHSEGSLIGMLAARQAGADAYVSIAGPAEGAADALRQQLRPKLSGGLAVESERILVALEHGEGADKVPAALNVLYRPSVQPYLISWFKYVPAAELAKLEVPVLIAQGTTDLQVPVAQAQALKQAKPAATLLIVPGMNHVLKMVQGDLRQQLPSYSDPALPLAPELGSGIAGFLKTNLK